MRVAYVYFLMENASFGVMQKVRQQASSIKRSGISDLDIYVLNPSIEEHADHLHFVIFKGVAFYPARVWYYMFNKRALMENAIDFSKYDRIILRHSFSDGSLLALAKDRPIVLEFHSKIITELGVKLAETRSLPKKIIRSVRIAIEKRYLYALVKASAGFITMGRELAEHYKSRATKQTANAVIFNGCDVSRIRQTGFKPFDGDELHMVFLGSRPDPWHGIPRLIRSISEYHQSGGSVKVTLHFVGKIKPADVGISESDQGFKFHGLLSDEKLDEVMSQMNVAVCTLAQYIKQLDETSAIKTVEYLARSIPFIIGYDDAALTNQLSLNDTYLKVANDDSDINLKEIIDFSHRVSADRESIMTRMRSYAEQNCDWAVKMQQYYDFACSAGSDR
jgi:hypothetical protein